jgi:hypothetical protein
MKRQAGDAPRLQKHWGEALDKLGDRARSGAVHRERIPLAGAPSELTGKSFGERIFSGRACGGTEAATCTAATPATFASAGAGGRERGAAAAL